MQERKKITELPSDSSQKSPQNIQKKAKEKRKHAQKLSEKITFLLFPFSNLFSL